MSKKKTTTVAEPRTLDTIRTELSAAREKLAGSYGDAQDKLTAQVATLATELDVSEARSIATVATPFGLAKPMEDDVELAFILVTGNHREVAHEADTVRLSQSLRDFGLQQRIGVRDMGDGNFELIFGSRRLAAAKLAEWDSIPAKIYSTSTTNEQVELLRLIENVQRAELTPTERALAVARLLATDTDADADRRIEAAGSREAYVGQLLGRSAAWVRDHSYINKLGGKARALLTAGRIDLGHARELAKLTNVEDTDNLAGDVARSEHGTNGKDVPYLARRVAETMRSLRGMPWRLDVVFGKFDRKCDGCRFNSKADPSLFEHDSAETVDALMAKAGTCLDSACFEDKKAVSEKLIEVGVKKAVKTHAEPTITLLADLIPEAIRPETFTRQVKKAIDPTTPAKPAKGEAEKVDHVYEAKRAWGERIGKWGNKTAAGILGKASKKPGSMIALHLLASTGALRKIAVPGYYAYSNDKEQAEKDFQSDFKSRAKLAAQTATARVLGYLKDPSFKNLCKLETDLMKDLQGDGDLGDVMPDALMDLAELFGVKVDDVPDRDAMIEAARSKE